MDLVISTQVHENYGAHNWDGTGECPRYWKPKGGEDYIVTGVPPGINLNDILTKASAHFKYERDDNYYREYVLGTSMEDEGFKTAFEQDQLEYEGEVRFPAKRVSYEELLITKEEKKMNDDLPERDEELEEVLTKAYSKMNNLESRLIPLHKALSSDRNSPCPCNSGKKVKKCCNNPQNHNLFNKLRAKYTSLVRILLNEKLMS